VATVSPRPSLRSGRATLPQELLDPAAAGRDGARREPPNFARSFILIKKVHNLEYCRARIAPSIRASELDLTPLNIGGITVDDGDAAPCCHCNLLR
jgi:hypothetical protein